MRYRRPAHSAVVSLFVAAFAACGGSGGDDLPPGPYDDVELTEDLRFDGLDGPIHVVRDRFGIVHINASTTADLAFAQGYMMAHDRLPQMDILRRFGAGTLSELFGALDEGVVESDLEMRMHRMKPTAEAAFAELQASSDEADQGIVTMLERFADGVNAYNADLVAGDYELDPAILVSYDPGRFAPWTPADSLVLGRFQAFALSWTAPIEIDLTDIYQQARDVFDSAPGPKSGDFDQDRLLRAGASRDLVQLAPIGRIATVDGFPNVSDDSGSRSDGTAGKSGATRPHVPRALLTAARRTFRDKLPFGPHALMVPKSGSNNWVVGPQHTGGKAMIAGDQHLSLPNPSIFYPCHLVVPGEIDVQGITFPGIPGMVLGHNGSISWSATVVFHDVNDVYLETIVPCSGGGGDCVVYDEGEVPIETWEEEIDVGALGTITETKRVTYENVPHHGPLIPEIADREIVPRSGSTALSVRYTGHSVTHEIRAFWKLARAESVDEAFTALGDFQYGGQNWVVIDNQGNIGWTSHADVPVREAPAYTFRPETNPDGNAPFFVLPGDGTAEWDGYLDSRYIPHAINPPQGYLATANSDPVGATFDGDPFDEGDVGGVPLYVGAVYATGLRTSRIATLLQERIDDGVTITLDDMAAVQHDSSSTFGARMRDPVVAGLDVIDDDQNRTATETAWLQSIGTSGQEALRDARERLRAWSFETPPAAGGDATVAQIDDSVATTIFNVFVHFLLDRLVGDEFAELGWDVYDVNQNLTARTLLAILGDPASLVSGAHPDTGDPSLCDDMRSDPQRESCALTIMMAMHDAMQWLASEEGFGTDDVSQWRWGAIHRLTLEPLFPEDQLEVPPPGDPDPALRGGYPKPGDTFVVNRADGGWTDLDFDTSDGPAQRWLAEVEPGGIIRAKMALPGGTIYDRASPHYRDLIDEYYIQHRHFDLPYLTDEVVAEGEARWVFRP